MPLVHYCHGNLNNLSYVYRCTTSRPWQMAGSTSSNENLVFQIYKSPSVEEAHHSLWLLTFVLHSAILILWRRVSGSDWFLFYIKGYVSQFLAKSAPYNWTPPIGDTIKRGKASDQCFLQKVYWECSDFCNGLTTWCFFCKPSRKCGCFLQLTPISLAGALNRICMLLFKN